MLYAGVAQVPVRRMSRFLKIEDLAPFGQVFRNFGQHFEFQSNFVIDPCRALH